MHADPDFPVGVTEVTGAASIGHCKVISWPNPMRQGALCALRPGEAPYWKRRLFRNKRTKKIKARWFDERTGEELPFVRTTDINIPYNKLGW